MIPFSPSPIQIFFFYWILLELILCRCYYRSNSSSPTWGVMLVSYMLVNFWQKIRSSLDLEIQSRSSPELGVFLFQSPYPPLSMPSVPSLSSSPFLLSATVIEMLDKYSLAIATIANNSSIILTPFPPLLTHHYLHVNDTRHHLQQPLLPPSLLLSSHLRSREVASHPSTDVTHHSSLYDPEHPLPSHSCHLFLYCQPSSL